jgi:hypothetical protein
VAGKNLPRYELYPTTSPLATERIRSAPTKLVLPTSWLATSANLHLRVCASREPAPAQQQLPP